eukprot:scaffold1253_cov65-Cylindrotheca_fusiformis.AAC.1
MKYYWKAAFASALWFITTTIEVASAFSTTVPTQRSTAAMMTRSSPLQPQQPQQHSLRTESSLKVGGYEMGGGGGSDEEEGEEPMVVLALKMAGILLIKTVKDVVNYPPMLLDEYSRKQQQQQFEVEGNIELTKSNPFVLLAKFMGVLAFKTVHDVVYYPALWVKEALEPKNNYDEYYY